MSDSLTRAMRYALRPFGSPYPWSFSLGSNQSDYLDDVRIAHPFLPPGEKVSTFLEGLVGSDEQKQLFAQGFQNVSELAQETCCQASCTGLRFRSPKASPMPLLRPSCSRVSGTTWQCLES